jgi:hypothetical protein
MKWYIKNRDNKLNLSGVDSKKRLLPLGYFNQKYIQISGIVIPFNEGETVNYNKHSN